MDARSDEIELSKAEILVRTRESLNWMFDDIQYAYESDANVGATILIILALDCFAGRKRGRIVGEAHETIVISRINKTKKRFNNKKAFNDFIQKYLIQVNRDYSQFSANRIKERDPYRDLRNMLIHAYSKKGYIIERDPKQHLSKRNSRLVLDIETFAKDARAAIEIFLDELEKGDEEIFAPYRKAYAACPLIGPSEPIH